jgi:Collagen triple helix repeat (20 copies)
MNLQDIGNLTDAEKLALVKAIQENVASSKAKQTSAEVGQYAKLVVDAIKKLKTDLEERYAEISADITVKSAAIRNGKDGINGAKGEKGDRGFDGVNGKDGRNGIDGKDGQDGTDGTGVQDAHIDFDGSLIITLTNGREINAGDVVPLDVAEKIKVIGNGGGTSQYVLDAIADLQTQINAVSGGLVYKGSWNASTNTPNLASSTGTNGWYYVVSVAGSTNLNGVTDWVAGDWAIYNGSAWQKIDQTNLVTSVAGRTGDVTLTSTDVGLANVENKSSTTIRGEITSSNVTTALGFTPYNATNPNGYTNNTGTVTSVALTTPTGLSVTGSPVTTSGTLALSLTSGYSIPTTASQTNWDTAYTDRNKWDGGATGLVAATGRSSLGLVIGTDVLAPTGSAASLTSFPTFNQNTTGSAGSLVTTGFSIVESGGKLLFKYGATTIASMSSTGVITSATNIVSNGTP